MRFSTLVLQLGLLLAQQPAFAESAGGVELKEIGVPCLDYSEQEDDPADSAQFTRSPETGDSSTTSRNAKTILKGTAKKHRKVHSKEDELLNLQAASDKAGANLGAVIQADPDAGDSELQIAWDKWRNRFSHAVWSKTCATLAGPGTMVWGSLVFKIGDAPGYNFPHGLSVTYACDVTSEGRIENIRLSQSSGNTRWDDIVLRSVKAQDKKRMLQFPLGSRRTVVTSQETLVTGKGGWHDRTYNDVEKFKAQN